MFTGPFSRGSALLSSLILLAATTSFAAELISSPASSAASTDPTKIKVLIVDGFSNHNWQLNTKLLRGILEPTGLFDVAVSTTPPKATAPGWDSWRPRFADYDVVIQTYNDLKGALPGPMK